MESLRRTFIQFRELFDGMAPSQRMTLVAVPLMVLAGLAFVMYIGVGPSEEQLLAGKVFSAEELRHAEDALRQAGLTQFRTDGQKILVPKAEVTRYNAALVANKGLPAQFGAELERMHKEYSLFASESQRRELLELAKQKELSKWIRTIPDIEDAGVIWERSKQRPFAGDAKVTATVSVRPRAGRELSSDLAQSLRLAVAGAVADLSANDVTVFNLATGKAVHVPAENDPFNSQFLDQINKYRESYQQSIAEALAFIPNVLVSVNVELDNLMTHTAQTRKIDKTGFKLKTTDQTNSEKSTEKKPGSEPGVVSNQPRNLKQSLVAETTNDVTREVKTEENIPVSTELTDKSFFGLQPKTVQVTVSIPEDYYRAVAIKQGVSAADKTAFDAQVKQIETQTKTEVTQKVKTLIPSSAPPEAVSVGTFVRLDPAGTNVEVPLTAQIGESLARWGGPAALALFALWSLWMLNRSMQKLPQETAAMAVAKAAKEEPEEEEEAPPPEPTKRDQLQTLVRDNPEMAAAVISRWLAPVKP